MKSISATVALILLLPTCPCWGESALEGFVLLKGGEFRLGLGASQKGRLARVEDFEILDHPVTDGEYQRFVRESGHAAPCTGATAASPLARSPRRPRSTWNIA